MIAFDKRVEAKQVNIYLYKDAIDFRKQANGLIQVVIDDMQMQPNDGSVYIFRSKKKDKLKLLVWDRNGFWLLYKRLEKGYFDFPAQEDGSIQISVDQYDMLVHAMPLLHLGIDAEKQVEFS